MIRGAISTAIFLGLAPASAIACSYPSYEETGVVIHADRLAERMVLAAATVDLMEVDSIEPWDALAYFAAERAQALAEARAEHVADVHADYDHYESQYRRFGASTVRFRVVQRFKGVGPAEFSFGAFVVNPTNRAFGLVELTDFIPEAGPLPSGEDLYMRRLVDLRDHQGMGSCSAPLVVSEHGQYIVFRDGDGALLRNAVAVTDPRDSPILAVDGPSFEAVNSKQDIWLRAVQEASVR